MKIGILGTRGIPNHYGGFEQFAEYLSVGLVDRCHDVWVYNSHQNPFKEPQWRGVSLIRCHDPEEYMGVPGQFVYDFNCILDSRNRNFDILLQLGYTSSSVWHRFLPSQPKIITNMDGLEWQRSKYNRYVQRFLQYAETLAIQSSDQLIADSLTIGEYLMKKYEAPSTYISYGADVFESPNASLLHSFQVNPKQYFLLIARMQPDNHIEEIIKGVLGSSGHTPLVIIGNIGNKYGKYLEKSYASGTIRFSGPLFDKATLNNLRYFSKLYFHGHSCGGTNPSLLEAMAASAPVCAHDNPFSREVLGQNALYFSNFRDISEIINTLEVQPVPESFILNNIQKICSDYQWSNVISAYEETFRGMFPTTDRS